MPGIAVTDSFMLGDATVMVGDMADLFAMSPANHSIGLVKNFSIVAEPVYTELTQGVKNTLVYSVLTSNPVRATMEVYEYSAKNLNYALGLDGTDVAKKTVASTVGTAITGDGIATSVVLATGGGAGFTVGDYITIAADTQDKVYVRKVTAKSIDTLTVNVPFAIGQSAAVGSSVKVVNVIGVGKKDDQPFLSATVVGKLANGENVAILIPKIRITKGFTLGFRNDGFGNMPFEFQVYDLLTTDTYFSEFNGDQARLMRQ